MDVRVVGGGEGRLLGSGVGLRVGGGVLVLETRSANSLVNVSSAVHGRSSFLNYFYSIHPVFGESTSYCKK